MEPALGEIDEFCLFDSCSLGRRRGIFGDLALLFDRLGADRG